MIATDSISYAFSAVVVLLTLGAVLWLLVKRKNVFAPKSSGRRIQLIESMPLSLKHKMMLVHVDNQMVLVSVGPQELKTLHAWTTGSATSGALVADAASSVAVAPADFRAVLEATK